MMKLYIAEKKEVANALAEALNGQATTPAQQAFAVPGGKVTWLSGHLLKLTDPPDGRWALDELPLVWPVKHQPLERSTEHLARVVALIQQADELIHAGDPDPEGQRLVDEVIEYAGGQHKPCQRILINDNNPAAILLANQKLEPNQHYHGLSMSALARAVCDQRYGYNLTRLYTLIAQQQGHTETLSVGRVQTPILGLVVNRDQAHESHQASLYWVVTASLDNLAGTASYQPRTSDPQDEKGRLTDPVHAEGLAAMVRGQLATVTHAETKPCERPAPLPYNLLALQADAANLFGYSPKQVLEITQRLRDQYRAITYNRSDCRYLNDERHTEATALLQALATQYGELAIHANPALKSKAFNSREVTAHHAIIPTLTVPNLQTLSTPERNVYELIAKLYMAQFYPPEQYRTTRVSWSVTAQNGESLAFKAIGRVDTAPGWLALYPLQTEEEDPSPRANLEGIKPGDQHVVASSTCQEQKTKPLPYYSMSELLKDLARCAKYVKDPHIKKLLLEKDNEKRDEAGGIGTPATRDSHIDTLFKRGFLTERGKHIVSTELGRGLISALPDFATSPDLTALWHEKQKKIEAGELDWRVLTAEVDQAIADEVSRLKSGSAQLDLPKTGTPCPTCTIGVLKRRTGAKGAFWSCSTYPTCRATTPDKNGKPDLSAKPVPSEHACPQCQQPLARKPSKKDKKQYWWGCTAYPACNYTAHDQNGTPKPKEQHA